MTATTRMEKVAEDIALAAIRRACAAAQPPLGAEALQAAFRAVWPTPDSARPMNDAMNAAAQAIGDCAGQDAEDWRDAVAKAWQPAVDEVIEAYFTASRRSFKSGELSQGAEFLAGVTRATVGNIAAARNWPHADDDNLATTATVLETGTGWPRTDEEFKQALYSLPGDEQHLDSVFSASVGLPGSIDFGFYLEVPQFAEKNGLSFVGSVIELAHRFAGREHTGA